MKTKSIFFLAVGTILVLSLLCSCSGKDGGAVVENDKSGNGMSENDEEIIDLSQLQWEGGLDEYFEFSVTGTDWNAEGPIIVYTQSMKIIQVKSGEIADVEFTIPVSAVNGFNVSCPETVRMGVNGVAEFQFSVTGSTQGKSDTSLPVIETEKITATGTFIPNN